LSTYPYDADNFQPPALVVDVELVHPNAKDKRRVTKKAQIDTGADGSVIPATLRDDWDLNKADDVITVDCHNRRTSEPTYNIRIVVNGLVSKIVEVTLVDGEDVLLGRDILNELKMCANGKTLSFTLEDP
jgi:predicted aspartyl protease